MSPSTFARPLLTAAVAISTLGGVVACAESDTLKVCTTVPFEPFQFKEPWQPDTIVGFDVDMMDLVAEELGKTQDIVEVSFSDIDSGEALADGVCDVAAAAVTITPERQQSMAFSRPYYDVDLGLAVPPESDHTSLDDLDGKVLGVQADTTGSDYALENAAEYGYVVEPFEDVALLREELQFGEEIDAGLDDVHVWNRSEQEEKLEVRERVDTGHQYGYAVGLDDSDLLATINSVIEASQQDGTYDSLHEDWIEGERED